MSAVAAAAAAQLIESGALAAAATAAARAALPAARPARPRRDACVQASLPFPQRRAESPAAAGPASIAGPTARRVTPERATVQGPQSAPQFAHPAPPQHRPNGPVSACSDVQPELEYRRGRSAAEQMARGPRAEVPLAAPSTRQGPGKQSPQPWWGAEGAGPQLRAGGAEAGAFAGRQAGPGAVRRSSANALRAEEDLLAAWRASQRGVAGRQLGSTHHHPHHHQQQWQRGGPAGTAHPPVSESARGAAPGSSRRAEDPSGGGVRADLLSWDGGLEAALRKLEEDAWNALNSGRGVRSGSPPVSWPAPRPHY